MAAEKTSQKFPLVGIGASAGGIESFKKFLSAVPDNSGMAYILVQHLSPSHDSILPDILAKITNIPVQEITDECHIAPDHIYVIPENKTLLVTDHELKLLPREKGALNMPIDIFFTSLAKVHQSLAIGVVLSGTAHDGTVGLRDIKEYGGITFAEDPDTAAWDGMPKSAIAAGVVDFVLPAEEIPSKLINVHAAYETTRTSADRIQTKKTDINEDGLKKILSAVQRFSGVDFSYYKRPTIIRRIDRRIAINQMADHLGYLEFLGESKAEQEALFQDLLIKVTAFFRDPEIFAELAEKVLPQLLADQVPDKPIRIWVTACATGEEVYSIAIALFELLGGLTAGHNMHRTKIQIFASDMSEVAINKARAGIYSATEMEPLSKRQREQYFTKTDGSYKVVKPIRDSIVFAVHNFLKDPPFGKVDLVSCRNVLIYMEPVLQKKLFATLHYALNENGFLLLGKSETTGTSSDLFVPFSKQAKIFTRKPGSGRFFQVPDRQGKNTAAPAFKKMPMKRSSKTDFRKNAESVLISRYTPASVIVDEHMEIVHISGEVAPFLEPSSGKPTHELMKMARKELAFELRNAIDKAKTTQESIIKEGIPVKNNGERFSANIEIVPLTETVDPHYLILFQKESPNTSFWGRAWKKLKPSFTASEKNHVQQRNTALERELEQAREDMRRISEDQEAFNEELQSTNEEMQSSNEEMQSLNEELETSKEELQSTNEELIIVNRELLEKQGELNHTLNYLEAIFANLREPLLVLEKGYNVQIANATFYKKFEVKKTQIEGKPFFAIQHKLWNNAALRTLLEKVLPEKGLVVDEEIGIDFPTGEKKSFMFNAREIEREKDSEKLILLSMEDITERKMTQAYKETISELQKTNEQLDRYVHVASHDLQEPLRKIMIFSNLLLEGSANEPDENRDTLKKIASSAERMSGLIKGLLEYSRVAHQGDLFEATDLNLITKDILSDFDLLIREKQAQLDIGQLPEIQAIPLQMNQLLANLIGNALKFSTKGVAPLIKVASHVFPKKEVEKHPSLSPKLNYCEIIVSDNGIGFSPKYQEQIFLIFQRLRESKEHKGSGIGLSLVKKIVENHHGAIYTVSEEGMGAAFHVILPVEQPK
ncbi:chemotaxis protein CheB [Ulvibacterium marinum]|uniref:histidine kinase n=1 Tax=Ulvibacterium marinum TaxID=2419782 RepID=A0A3B0CBY9_9FLAO|nr:chemotaxis protein CheB [Ulvibacterium marinum]RKN83463.1 hypothetical protein D7Z94_06505 [Ulvibacterium marinum]